MRLGKRPGENCAETHHIQCSRLSGVFGTILQEHDGVTRGSNAAQVGSSLSRGRVARAVIRDTQTETRVMSPADAPAVQVVTGCSRAVEWGMTKMMPPPKQNRKAVLKTARARWADRFGPNASLSSHKDLVAVPPRRSSWAIGRDVGSTAAREVEPVRPN